MKVMVTLISARSLGALVALGLVGCGSKQPVGVEAATSPSIPKRPTPMPGNASLTGRVRDASGAGVAGAVVKVAETDVTATADANGDYYLAVPSDSTLTLSTTAAGFAPSHRESIVLASQAMVSAFDILALPVDTVSRLGALAAPNQVATRGLMAIRLHSLNPTCTLAGAQVSVWPPQAATVMYSRLNPDGLQEPDAIVPAVQVGTGIGVWLVGVIPPGNMLQINVKQGGCQQLMGSPSMGGVVFSGLRRVDVQALTEADVFFE